jgi:hypothetical protein
MISTLEIPSPHVRHKTEAPINGGRDKWRSGKNHIISTEITLIKQTDNSKRLEVSVLAQTIFHPISSCYWLVGAVYLCSLEAIHQCVNNSVPVRQTNCTLQSLTIHGKVIAAILN